MSADVGPSEAASPWPVWPEGFAETSEDRRALYILSALRGITPRALIALAIERGSAAATLASIQQGRAGSENDRAFAGSLDADEIASAARSCDARLVTWGSPEYPFQLREIHDPPAALYVIGRAPPEVTRSVAIVGARRCTALGRETSHDVARALGLAGVSVVSGAARGIDAAAHEGALSANAHTVAVLGSGLDVVYPLASRRLIRRIASVGTVLSEYAPGTPPLQRNFPARNRIVAGLCRATVVVEGAVGSGSMITTEHAMEFGRDVFAVPGPVSGALSSVPLQLIRDGATLIRGPEDLLSDLGLELVHDAVAERVDLDADERRVLDRMVQPTLADRLAGELGMAVPDVVGVLMRLELRGLVRNVGGRYESTLRARRAQAERESNRSARGTPDRATSRTGTLARSRRLAAIDDR